MKKIVVGIDGSALSDRAIERALDEASCRDVEVILVSVAEVLSTLSLMKDWGQMEDTFMAEPRQILADALKRFKDTGIRVSGRVECGRPALILAETARAEHADEIMVGSRGKHAMDRLLLGSVSSRLIEIADCTVVVVR